MEPEFEQVANARGPQGFLGVGGDAQLSHAVEHLWSGISTVSSIDFSWPLCRSSIPARERSIIEISVIAEVEVSPYPRWDRLGTGT